MKLKASDFNLFPISRPWGYYTPEVDKTIQKYENALSNSLARIKELEIEKEKMSKELIHARNELRSMHLQMASLEVPPVDDAVTKFVLDDFKASNRSQQEEDEEFRPLNNDDKDKPLDKGNPVEVNRDDEDGDSFIIAQ